MKYFSFLVAAAALGLSTTAFAKPLIKKDTIWYKAGNTNLKGIIVYDASSNKKRPAVMVVHEWWGLQNYEVQRAEMLAKLGYVAMCIDMYGDGKVGNTPDEAQQLAQTIYSNPALLQERFMAAYNTLAKHNLVDVTKMAAIGYCFGGSVVLNAAKMGAPLKGVVSFHGGLQGPEPKKDVLKAKILVCHGGDDKFVSEQEISTFKKQLDAIGAYYEFKVYPNATHAFTNPEATAIGKKFNMPIAYNEAADKASWSDMQTFFKKIF